MANLYEQQIHEIKWAADRSDLKSIVHVLLAATSTEELLEVLAVCCDEVARDVLYDFGDEEAFEIWMNDSKAIRELSGKL
jgi:hypothetical protein